MVLQHAELAVKQLSRSGDVLATLLYSYMLLGARYLSLDIKKVVNP